MPQEGKFGITAQTTVVIPAANDGFKMAADFFVQQFATASGIRLNMVFDTGNAPTNSITFRLSDDTELGDEGYTLSVTKTGVTVEAITGNGAFYAIQTIMQLLPPEIYSAKKQRVSWSIPCVEITDKP